ncbi:MAG: DUF6510 family protein [Candidatus Dormibacteraceae bacterium]
MSDAEIDRALDGNAIAGLLEGLFGRDLTSTPRVCATCGATNEVGRHRLYRGAGLVLRCPGCGAVAARITEVRGGAVIELTGAWILTPRG